MKQLPGVKLSRPSRQADCSFQNNTYMQPEEIPKEHSRNKLVRDVYESHYKALYVYARRLCTKFKFGPERANDFIQELFLKIIKKYDKNGFVYSFHNIKYLRTMLYRIVLDESRSGKQYAELPESIKNEEPFYLDEPVLGQKEQESWIYKKSCRFLKPKDRKILDLHLKDYGNKEIGVMLGLKKDYIDVRLHRIKKNIAKMILRKDNKNDSTPRN